MIAQATLNQTIIIGIKCCRYIRWWFRTQWNGAWQSDVGYLGLDCIDGRYQPGDKLDCFDCLEKRRFPRRIWWSTYEMTAANDEIKATGSYADRDGILGTGKVRLLLKMINITFHIRFLISQMKQVM